MQACQDVLNPHKVVGVSFMNCIITSYKDVVSQLKSDIHGVVTCEFPLKKTDAALRD